MEGRQDDRARAICSRAKHCGILELNLLRLRHTLNHQSDQHRQLDRRDRHTCEVIKNIGLLLPSVIEQQRSEDTWAKKSFTALETADLENCKIGGRNGIDLAFRRSAVTRLVMFYS